MEQEKKKVNLKIVILIAIAIAIIAVITSIVIKNNSISDKYYQNSAFENLKTFTEITGINEKNVEQEITNIKYIYQFQDTQNSNIDYENYLFNDYGFSVNQNKSDDNKKYFEHENKTIITEKEAKAGFIKYTITIPLNEEIANKNTEENYNQALELINNEKYDEAYKILHKIAYKYKDTAKLENYCEGMIHYKTYLSYGTALDYFERAENILNTEQIKSEILDIISKYNGTYYAEHLKYPNKGIGYFMFVKDGKVALEFESIYKEGSSVYYNQYQLMSKFVEQNNTTTLMIGNNITKKPTELDYEYSFDITEEGNIMVIRYETNSYSTFNGLYTKISDTAPDIKH